MNEIALEQKNSNRKIITMISSLVCKTKANLSQMLLGMPGMDAIVFIRKFRS
jgi:hypothetical protein